MKVVFCHLWQPHCRRNGGFGIGRFRYERIGQAGQNPPVRWSLRGRAMRLVGWGFHLGADVSVFCVEGMQKAEEWATELVANRELSTLPLSPGCASRSGLQLSRGFNCIK